MTTNYLSLADVSTRIEVNHNTVKAWHRTGKLPAADVTIGRGNKIWQGWSERTIDRWNTLRMTD